jgi:cell division protein FtsL
MDVHRAKIEREERQGRATLSPPHSRAVRLGERLMYAMAVVIVLMMIAVCIKIGCTPMAPPFFQP